MKKNFSRILSAVVAIPVTLSQIFAISALAIDTPDENLSCNTTQILKVPGDTNFPTDAADTLAQDGLQTITFEQESVWNETIESVLANVEDGTTVEVKVTDLADAFGSSYFAGILQDVLLQSGNATAFYDASAQSVTIQGSLDLSAYFQAEFNKKLEENTAYAKYDIDTTLNTKYTSGITYEVVVDLDLDSKSGSGSAVFNTPKGEYTVSTISEYLDVIYQDIVDQIETIVDERLDAEMNDVVKPKQEEAEANLADAQAQLDEAQAALDEAKESGVDVDEKQAELDAAQADLDAAKAEYEDTMAEVEETIQEINDKVDAEMAEFQETTDALKSKIDQVASVMDQLATATLQGTKSYAISQEVYAAALNWLSNKYPNVANRLPASADDAFAKYGSMIEAVVDVVNDALDQSGANVTLDITASDVQAVFDEATDITAATESAGALTVQFTVEEDATDAQYSDVVAYLEAQDVADQLDFSTLTTKKYVTVTVDATNGTASFDVDREVSITEIDPDKTTTTTTDTTSTTTEIPVATGTTETTVSGEEGGDTSTSTTTVSGEGGNGSSTSTTAGTVETTTTAKKDGTTTSIIQPDVDEISSISVSVSEGVYFDTDESFDASELVKSVTLTMKNGSKVSADPATVIAFANTPSELYESDAAIHDDLQYYVGTVTISYKDTNGDTLAISAKPTVGVAKKGDTDLNGKVDIYDANATLIYYSNMRAGVDYTFSASISSDDEFVEKLIYFVSDVDTESKDGKDTDDAEISIYDAYHILLKYSSDSAGLKSTWDEVIAQ
ncbi:MAG: hypothetical protein LUC50_00020 [Ruminococcus sp.]|nr:hypothetical protein [Ruminococcus sp.]